jgi:hypothetical protein
MEDEERDRLIQSDKEHNIDLLHELLDGPFVNINPYDLSDKELFDFLTERTINKINGSSSLFSDFFTLYFNRGIQQREYNIFYYVVVFEPYPSASKDTEMLIINCSQFQYEMSLDNYGWTGSWSSFDPNNANMISQVNETRLDNPISFFTKNKNKLFMIAACYPCVNGYNKKKHCYDLYSINENSASNYIRKIIIETQEQALQHLLLAPYHYYDCTISDNMIYKHKIDPFNICKSIISIFENPIKEKIEFLGQRKREYLR